MTRPDCLDMADPGELHRLHTAGPAASVLTLLMSPPWRPPPAASTPGRPTLSSPITARRTRLSASRGERSAENHCRDRSRPGDDGAVSDGAAALGGTGDPGTVAMLYLCVEVAG